jgi:hypothetical protein
MAKTTLATIKSFIKKSNGNLYIRERSRFDGMVDCVMPTKDDGFNPALPSESANSCGVHGAWFVFSGRDYFEPLAEQGFVGWHVSNCTGSFDLAVKS